MHSTSSTVKVHKPRMVIAFEELLLLHIYEVWQHMPAPADGSYCGETATALDESGQTWSNLVKHGEQLPTSTSAARAPTSSIPSLSNDA
jgi:hypothetical protein